MGHWGAKSYENDDADDAIDRGFEYVHGDAYDDLMDDRNPLSFDQVQKKLADTRTLAASVRLLEEIIGSTLEADADTWDDEARLAMAGVVVRHAEFGVSIPDELCQRAIGWLEAEKIDWDDETKRRLRREKEIVLLRRARSSPATGDEPRGE